MKIKNYRFEGFGFPVIFDELPAVKVRGELVPDVDFDKYAKPLIEHICARQGVPLSGNQVKFIRNYFGMSLREFAKMLNVTHQSVMRWEDFTISAAHIDVNTEIVFRLIILKQLGSAKDCFGSLMEKLEALTTFEKKSNYKNINSIHITK
ncbi:helix-turn-helix domain-containing protein [Bdellovibrio sp.]|uniref:helix-turn-helix domain-containing protein n=1 Tax=Bdellovibrio sp. TaxID=28201 RepID=UPI0039E61596